MPMDRTNHPTIVGSYETSSHQPPKPNVSPEIGQNGPAMERDIPCSCCDPSLPGWLAMPVVQYCSEGHDFTFSEITAMVLGKMMETTEANLSKEAMHLSQLYFFKVERQATKDTSTIAIASLQILHIINERTATTIASGLGKKSKSESQIIVVT